MSDENESAPAPERRDPVTPPPARGSGGITRWPLIAAAALLVAGATALYFIMRPPPPAPVDPALTAARIRALAGNGLLEGPDAKFSWSREPRADVYRIEVYDASSRLLAAAVLRDTSIAASALLPDSAHAGVWRVVPVSKGGTELPPTPSTKFVRL